jgi:photosynthetic reaction center H subunit
MEVGAINGYMDVAQVMLYVFWAFFIGLLFYLRREDRREGYPLLSEATGKQDDDAYLWMAAPKNFKLADGRVFSKPDYQVDARTIAAAPQEGWLGAPLVPTGDPMLAGVGPGAYAERADIADATYEGHARIVPMRVAPTFHVELRDTDPRGLKVYGCDMELAGTVTDIWVDRSEFLIRYLEVQLTNSARTVLVPFNIADIASGARARILVDSITAAQFATVPGLRNPDRVTLLEEDKIMGYYGGGTLYATPNRQEPIL